MQELDRFSKIKNNTSKFSDVNESLSESYTEKCSLFT